MNGWSGGVFLGRLDGGGGEFSHDICFLLCDKLASNTFQDGMCVVYYLLRRCGLPNRIRFEKHKREGRTYDVVKNGEPIDDYFPKPIILLI